MKTKLSIFLLIFISISFAQENKEMAMCCSNDLEKGRCTGSSYCTACSNCSRCGYCNSGGSCGVCAGSSTTSYSNSYNYSKRKKRKTYKSSNTTSKSYYNSGNNNYYNSSNGIYYLADDLSSKYYYKTLIVNAENLNLRKGPGVNYKIIDRLRYKQKMIFLAMIGDWVKVRVIANNKEGYVHKKFILVLN